MVAGVVNAATMGLSFTVTICGAEVVWHTPPGLMVSSVMLYWPGLVNWNSGFMDVKLVPLIYE